MDDWEYVGEYPSRNGGAVMVSYDTSGVYVEVKPGDETNWSGPLAYEQAHELRAALDTALAGVAEKQLLARTAHLT